MKYTEPNRMKAENPSTLGKGDRNKLIIMVVAVVVLGISYFTAKLKEGQYRADEEKSLANQAVRDDSYETLIKVPEFTERNALASVSDSAESSRVIIEAEPIDVLMKYAARLGDPHYRALDVTELDAASIAEISANTDGMRTKAFRARGEILALRKQMRGEPAREEFFGVLGLEDGGEAHFLVQKMPQGAGRGDYIRVDGLFFKLFMSELPSGDYANGPLLLGREAIGSYPKKADTKDLSLASLEEVADDEIGGIVDLPHEARWDLMAWAKYKADDIDWEAAPELSNEAMVEIWNDPEKFRGKPYRLPVCRNQGSWVAAVGENPLRIDKITTGYIGNMTWKGQAPLFKYIAPFESEVLQDMKGEARYVVGKGFFLKNLVYEQRDGKPVRAPLFVMAEVTPFHPDADNRARMLMFGVLGGTLLTVFVMWLLLVQDKRKSAKLQEELVRRRRARRSATAQAQPS